MNIKRTNTNVLSSDTNFALNLVNYVQTSATDFTNAERLINQYAKNRIPSLVSQSSPYDKESFQADLQFLSRKMEAVRKTLSIGESYRISDVAANRDELEYKLGSLAPNSGLVVNFAADNEEIGDKSYSQGDVVFKDYLGNSYLLKSFSGGYYYPYKATYLNEAQTIVKIDYQYANSLPVAVDEAVALTETPLAQPATNITLSMAEANTQDRYETQGIIEPGAEVSIRARDNLDNEFIRPIVAGYTLDDQGNKIDRIYFDGDWSYDKTTKIITLINHTTEKCWCEVR